MQNPWWRHNVIGCYILEIFRQMYNFNVNYTMEAEYQIRFSEDIDLYAYPMTISSEMMDFAHPTQVVVLWRFGFILRRPNNLSLFYRYYSKPFTRPVWNCLYLIALVASLVFYLLNWWEKRLVRTKWPCSFLLQILLTIGGHCQHVFAVDTVLNSRRMAYFIFFLYAYVIYTFYTSNLLSHLVNDRENDVELEALINGNYDMTILEDMKNILHDGYLCYACRNTSLEILQMLRKASVLKASAALEAVVNSRTALLTDYNSVYPLIKRTFKEKEICHLIELDLYSKVGKYLLTSKHFRFKEQLKIGILRVKEAGILRRLTLYDIYNPLTCEHVDQPEVGIFQIFTPCMILLLSYVACIGIMFVERWYYRNHAQTLTKTRHQVFPYVN